MPINPNAVAGSGDLLTLQRIQDLQRAIDELRRQGGGVGGGGSVDLTPFVRKDTLTTKGDLFVMRDDGVIVRLPVGPDGYVLTADSSVAEGVSWQPGGVVPTFPTYTLSNVTGDRTLNCDLTTLDELADVLGTVISDYPLPLGSYSFSNVTTDRTLDADSTTLDELADVLATATQDLIAGNTGQTWNLSNAITSRSLDADLTTINGLADVLCTFIADLQAIGDL